MSKKKIVVWGVVIVMALLMINSITSGGTTEKEVQPAAQATTEESVQPEAKAETEAEAPEKPVQSARGYQEIHNEYSARLNAECPSLSMTECAELSNEGVAEMAKYMYRASGTDGQYATYEEWAGKLMDVYLGAVQ